MNDDQQSIKPIKAQPLGTGKLAFRDLEQCIKAYVSEGQALDFGCGAGRSTQLLKSYGFSVVGVDISATMIEQARQNDSALSYELISGDNFKHELSSKQFDLIMLSFVIMELASPSYIVKLFRDLATLLKPCGKLAIIAASDELYQQDWLSINTSKYPENKQADSGDIVKLYLPDYDVEISDYLWFEHDCENFFDQAGLRLLKKHKPLASPERAIAWQAELNQAPFVIYILENRE